MVASHRDRLLVQLRSAGRSQPHLSSEKNLPDFALKRTALNPHPIQESSRVLSRNARNFALGGVFCVGEGTYRGLWKCGR